MDLVNHPLRIPRVYLNDGRSNTGLLLLAFDRIISVWSYNGIKNFTTILLSFV
jgi:hypothetical protein